MSNRMVSPLKPSNSSLETSPFRPKAKLNSSAVDTTRKATSTVSGGSRCLALDEHAHVMNSNSQCSSDSCTFSYKVNPPFTEGCAAQQGPVNGWSCSTVSNSVVVCTSYPRASHPFIYNLLRKFFFTPCRFIFIIAAVSQVNCVQ